jgi:polyferredoxin
MSVIIVFAILAIALIPILLVVAIALGQVVLGILCALGFGLVVAAVGNLVLGAGLLGRSMERTALRLGRHR